MGEQSELTGALAGPRPDVQEKGRISGECDGPASKRAMINGLVVDLHAVTVAYFLLTAGVLLGLLLPLVLMFTLQGNWASLPPPLIYCVAQSVPAGLMGYGYVRSRRAFGEAKWVCWGLGFFVAIFGYVPLLGLLSAAGESGRIHWFLSAVGVPVGVLGPRLRDIGSLRHGVCPCCGYRLAKLNSDHCPECNTFVAPHKPEAEASVGPLEIDVAAAERSAARCMRAAVIGVVLSFAQFAAYVFFPEAWSGFLFVVWLVPSAIAGIVFSFVTFEGQRILRQRHAADYLGIALLSLVLLPLAGAMLYGMSKRLKLAARSGRADDRIAAAHTVPRQ